MAVGEAYVFSGFLTPVLTQLFFPKPPTTFLTYFCRGERRKYAGKKSYFNRGSNSQPPGHESNTLTTEPPGRGGVQQGYNQNFLLFPKRFHRFQRQLFFCLNHFYFVVLKCFSVWTRLRFSRSVKCLGRNITCFYSSSTSSC